MPAVTTIDRSTLLDALKKAEPALSNRALIPKLQQFWFTGEAVRATDGNIGIEIPLKTKFTGGVPGKVLLGFISSVSRDKLKVEQTTGKDDKNYLEFSAGRARIALPFEELDDGIWLFNQTDEEPDSRITLDDQLRKALSFAMTSVTNNTTNDEHRGMTFMVEGKFLSIYSTDAASLCQAKVPAPELWTNERFVVPGEFISEALKLLSDGGEIIANPAIIEARAEDGSSIFSLFLNVSEPTDFATTIKNRMGKGDMVFIPDGFGAALERVQLLRDDKDGVLALFSFDNKTGSLRVQASSTFGELDEELFYEGNHAELTVRVLPELLIRGLSERVNFVASKRCIIMNGPDNFTYVVASS